MQSRGILSCSFIFNASDVSCFGGYTPILSQLCHVTDSNDESWLTDRDLFHVCELFGGSEMQFGEFQPRFKDALKYKHVAHTTSKNPLRALGFDLPYYRFGLENASKTKCYANVAVILLWKMKFAHLSFRQDGNEANKAIVDSLQSVFASLAQQQSHLRDFAAALEQHRVWKIKENQQDCFHEFMLTLMPHLGEFGNYFVMQQRRKILYNGIQVVNKVDEVRELVIKPEGSIQLSITQYSAPHQIQFEPEPGLGVKECTDLYELVSMPDILHLHLHRFNETSPNEWTKSRQNVNIDIDISVAGSNYTLFAVVIHSGNSQNSGHYEVLINEELRQHWILYNDTHVNRVKFPAQLAKIRGGYRTAQHLFYINKEKAARFFPFAQQLNEGNEENAAPPRKRQKISHLDYVELSSDSMEMEPVSQSSNSIDLMQLSEISVDEDIEDEPVVKPKPKKRIKKEIELTPAIEIDGGKYTRTKMSKKLSINNLSKVIMFRYQNNEREWLLEWRNGDAMHFNWFLKSELSTNCHKQLTNYLRSSRALLQQGWIADIPKVPRTTLKYFRDTCPQPGPVGAPKSLTALEAFEMFFTRELQQQLVDEMNEFAILSNDQKQQRRIRIRRDQLLKAQTWAKQMEQKYPALIKSNTWTGNLQKLYDHYNAPITLTDKEKIWQHNSAKQWRKKPLTLDEFRTFLGVTIAITVVKGRRVRDNWIENNPLYGNEWVSSRISSSRYELIWKNFHYDVDSLIASLKKKYQAHWTPHQHVTFDETITPFLGKFFAKQYIPTKPHPNGILLYLLADSQHFVWDLDVYLGLCLPPKYQLLEVAEKLAARNDGYILTTDSKWGSEEASRKLDELGLYFLLSAKKNSPSYVFDNLQTNLQENCAKSYYTNGKFNLITATSFKDKSAIMNLFSNYIADRRSWQPLCPKVNIFATPSPSKSVNPSTASKPLCAQEYAYAKGFVDEAARQIHTFAYPHKFLKWTQALFATTITITAWNSFIYFKAVTKHDGIFREYLEKIARELAQVPSRSPKRPSKLYRIRSRRGVILWQIQRIEHSTNQMHVGVPSKYFSETVRGRCTLCPKAKRQQTTLICLACSKSGHLQFICTGCSARHIRKSKVFDL